MGVMTPGERIALILAEQGYHLRDDDTSVAPVGFVRLRYGKGRWLGDREEDSLAHWQWDAKDHNLLTVELPEAFFTPGYPEADR